MNIVINIEKIFYAALCIIFFSILYLLCNNDEFSGLIRSKGISKNIVKKKIIFNNLKTNDNYITFKEFNKIKIYKKDKKIFITNNLNNFSYSNKLNLFKFYSDNNDKLNFNTFNDIPFNYSKYNFSYTKKNIKIIKELRNPVINYFDRLYFSFIVQTTLGLGDIYPSSKRVRIITIIQSFSTILILLINL